MEKKLDFIYEEKKSKYIFYLYLWDTILYFIWFIYVLFIYESLNETRAFL